MTIVQYQSKDGTPLFKISIYLRSKFQRDIRVARQMWAIPTLQEATREHKKMLTLAQDALHKKEQNGRTLRTLICRWYVHSKRVRVGNGEVGLKLINDQRGTLEKWFNPHLKSSALSITSFLVQNIVREKQLEGYSRAQLQKFKGMVRSIWQFGIAAGIVPPGTKCPAEDVKVAARSERTPEIHQRDESIRLISKAFEIQHPWRYIWALALLTGMRSGELQALMWPQVLWDRKRIRVSYSFDQYRKTLKSPKNGTWRDVPLNPQALALLAQLRDERGNETFVLPRFKEWEQGRQASVLRAFCEQLGLPSIRFHTLRACFATQLFVNGESQAKVMKMAGWAHLETAQRYFRLAGVEVEGGTESLNFLPISPVNAAQALDIRN